MSAIGPGALVDGRYRILSRLGTGGMADVFLAEDTQLERQVALKLLHRRFAEDPGFVERFRREAQSAAGLQHPNVVSVFDRGTWDGTYYIAMEYLQGRTLKQVIRMEAPLDPLRAIDITTQILKATRSAHRRGIIHRDLKPHNVMLDDSDHVKVTDFGIARAGASDMTETGSIMGTAQYLSPEQAQGLAVGATSDLYSVGVILYEELTGHVPFDADSAVSIALKHVSEAPVPPSRYNPNLPPALEQTVLWSLNKRPEDRPQDADQFIHVLAGVREQLTAGGTGQVTASMAALGAEEAAGPGAGAAVAGGLLGAAAAGALGAGAADAADRTVPAGPLPRVQLGGTPVSSPSTAMYPKPEESGVIPAVGPDASVPPPADPDGRRSWWAGALPWLIGLLIILLLAGGAVAYEVTRPSKAVVPAVVNLTQQEAVSKIEAAGFSPQVIQQSSTAASGTVIYQSPLGGIKADTSRTVTLTVSSGPGSTTVPAVVQDTRAQAIEALHLAGLRVSRILTESSSSVTKGDATRTDPDAGTSLQTGGSVVLYLSSGVAPVPVPTVTHDTLATAQAALTQFSVSVTQQVSSTATAGTVISQTPAGGSTALPGAKVTLVVAEKPPEVTLPDLVGQSLKAAEATLKGLGLTATTTKQTTAVKSQNGLVLAQSPVAEKKVKVGSTVTLTVGSYSATDTTTNPTGPTGPTGITGLGGSGSTGTPTTATATTPITTTAAATTHTTSGPGGLL